MISVLSLTITLYVMFYEDLKGIFKAAKVDTRKLNNKTDVL